MASIYGAVSATGWRLRLDYTVSQDAANNRSTLALTLYIYDGTGESYNQAANSCRYVLQGKTVYQPYRYESKGWYKLGGSLSVSQTVTLPVIPRASMLQAGDMTLGQSGTITVQRADASFTHKINYQIGSAHGTVCEKTGETRVTWTPPLSLAEEITDAVAGDCVLTATTYSGSSVVGTSSRPIKLYVPEEVKPTASLAAQVVNDNAVIAGWGVCVRGYSRLAYQVTAAGARGSSIRSCRVQFAGQTVEGLTGETGIIRQAGTFTPEVRVTDSRGRWTTAAGQAVEVLPYANPTLTARLLGRCDADGVLQDDGDCVKELRALGTPAICWSVDTEDWKSRNVDSILDIVLRQAGDGDILLLHDCYPTSVTAALEIVDRLQPRGVRFVTVEELFAVKGVQPACGTLYRRVRGE